MVKMHKVLRFLSTGPAGSLREFGDKFVRIEYKYQVENFFGKVDFYSSEIRGNVSTAPIQLFANSFETTPEQIALPIVQLIAY